MGEILASLFESILFSVFLILFLESKRGRKELFSGTVLTSGLLFLNIFISDKIGVYNVFSFADSSMIFLFQERDIIDRTEILVLSKLLLLLYIIFMIHFRAKFRHHKQGISMLCYSILPICILFFFIRSANTLIEIYKMEPALGRRMAGIMMDLHFIVIAAIYLSIHAAGNAEEEYHIERLNHMLMLQRNSLEEFNSQEKKLHKIKHELEHKLYTVQYLLEKHRNEEGLQIMKEMIRELCGGAKDISVSQNIVETVITNIERKYEAERIHIEKEILFPDETLMELVDLCVLLGDLLDNAMEAAAKSTEKQIEISIREEYNCLYLKISNTFSAEDSDVKSFISKKEKGRHGFGIWNIREIVKRYGGELITYEEDHWFYVNAVIYGKNVKR